MSVKEFEGVKLELDVVAAANWEHDKKILFEQDQSSVIVHGVHLTDDHICRFCKGKATLLVGYDYCDSFDACNKCIGGGTLGGRASVVYPEVQFREQQERLEKEAK